MKLSKFDVELLQLLEETKRFKPEIETKSLEETDIWKEVCRLKEIARNHMLADLVHKSMGAANVKPEEAPENAGA